MEKNLFKFVAALNKKIIGRWHGFTCFTIIKKEGDLDKVKSRVTLFVLAMLRKTELVKPVLEQYPSLIFAKGPHGFTMLHQAKRAGKNGEDLYTWLEDKGLKDTWVKIK